MQSNWTLLRSWVLWPNAMSTWNILDPSRTNLDSTVFRVSCWELLPTGISKPAPLPAWNLQVRRFPSLPPPPCPQPPATTYCQLTLVVDYCSFIIIHSSSTGLSVASNCSVCTASRYCEGGGTSASSACVSGHYCPVGTQFSKQYPCPPGMQVQYSSPPCFDSFIDQFNCLLTSNRPSIDFLSVHLRAHICCVSTFAFVNKICLFIHFYRNLQSVNVLNVHVGVLQYLGRLLHFLAGLQCSVSLSCRLLLSCWHCEPNTLSGRNKQYGNNANGLLAWVSYFFSFFFLIPLCHAQFGAKETSFCKVIQNEHSCNELKHVMIAFSPPYLPFSLPARPVLRERICKWCYLPCRLSLSRRVRSHKSAFMILCLKYSPQLMHNNQFCVLGWKMCGKYQNGIRVTISVPEWNFLQHQSVRLLGMSRVSFWNLQYLFIHIFYSIIN
jgi:hypothetical protein